MSSPLSERPDQRCNRWCPNLPERIGRPSPDDPVLILKPPDKRFDKWFAQITNRADGVPPGVEIPVSQGPEEVIVALPERL